MSRFILIVVAVFALNKAEAQDSMVIKAGTAYRPAYDYIHSCQVRYIDSLYLARVNTADELINGREYIPYYLKCRISPLLYENKHRNGSMLLNGRLYRNLTLEYDTYLDQLIYSDSTKLIDDRIFKIAMNKDPVEEFRLYFAGDSMIFRHFRNDGNSAFSLPDGFYEVVYDGNSQFIVKHQSRLIEKDGLYEYRYLPVRYLSTGKGFTKVRSSRSFLKMMGKYSPSVKMYMRSNGIHFQKADNDGISAVMRYYDSISGPADSKR
jgi:hypothetical protein